MNRLDGKVALITGAAMGQGAAEALLFVQEGAKVMATDMNETALQKTVAEINAQYPDRIIGMVLNVSEESQWQKVVDAMMEKWGRIDILVNNAGVGSRGINYDHTSREDFDAIMGVNAWGPFVGMKCVAPIMKQQHAGSIVNISSLAGVVGVEFNAYTLTKGAVVALTRGASQELGKDGIRVNTIIPGTIETPMTQMLKDMPSVYQACQEKTMLGHIGEPNDIAYGVLYFASDEAKYVTGADLTIDGGERYKDSLELDLG